MIALDTSALVAMALEEAEAEAFAEAIARNGAEVGTPTLLETRMVLSSRLSDEGHGFMNALLRRASIQAVAFTLDMHAAAVDAFARYGRGRGHPAQLNFGDCMAYAVARHRDLPLLFKGGNFALTDIRPALA